ncbi:comF family protein [Moraxella cuniculi DSM 21768]|uniref:ComF family protein n=1 Tax=Moraxella cuniculi DSM 21768 TaxID=1122245 RepID=A0A1N7DAA6_9GAMM|nr:ComF family protein [Moraxella cuniculi]SIR72665.1 comF family protein [Moraxella cuniculi DSM 21768]
MMDYKSPIWQKSAPDNPVVWTVQYVHYQMAVWLHRLHRHCSICGQRQSVAQLICQHCMARIATKLAPESIPLDMVGDLDGRPSANQSDNVAATWLRVYPISYYQYPINFLIKKFKENEQLTALLALYGLIMTLPKPIGCHAKNTVILPIPTTTSRIRRRGFNPVLTLAKCLAKHWGLPIWQGVARHDDSQSQRGLDRKQRLNNTMDFYLCQAIPACQVIIFDDVLTTGATMASVARLLRGQNDKVRLLGVCLAHGTPKHGAKR